MFEPRIGVIDSGFALHQRALIKAKKRFWLNAGALHEGDCTEDLLGHGSLVLASLSKQIALPHIYLAQVFSEGWLTSPVQIAAAIYWLVDEHQVSQINMSLGLRDDRPVLREACEYALAQGVMIFASSPAYGQAVYPASYPGVIKVTGDARCGPGQWSWLNDSLQADFGAHVRADQGAAGASIACAALTGIAAALARQVGPEQMLEALKAHAQFVGVEKRAYA